MSPTLVTEDTIKPRLQAAGAEQDRVHDLSTILERGEERCPEIPLDLPLLDATLAEHNARLLVIDPLAAFLYGSDANKDQEIRRVLYKLSRIAERRRCAVICMRHLNKGNSGKALYRGNMSIAVIGHARAGLLVAPDPDDDRVRILAVVKCNLAEKPASMRFALEPVGEVCRIAWMGASPYVADDLVQAPPTEEEKQQKEEARTKVEACKDVLETILSQGPRPLKACKEELAQAGFTAATIQRAASQLRVKFYYQVEAGKRVYLWELPT